MRPSLARFGAPLLFLAAFLAPTPAHATGLTVEVKLSPIECMASNLVGVGKITFGDMKGTGYSAKCASEWFKTSVVANMEQYCTEEQQVKGWDLFSSFCVEYGKGAILEDRANVTKRTPDRLNMTQINIFTHSKKVKVNETVLLDQYSFDMSWRTRSVWARATMFHHAFGWSQYILLGVAILIGLFNRIYSAYLTRLVVNAGRSVDRAEMAPAQGWVSRLSAKYQKYLGMPALVKRKHVDAYAWYSLPTRLEGLVVFAYVAINVIFSCVAYDAFDDMLYYPNNIPGQVERYIADRTAIMSFYNLPILMLLAGRNDVILWITGWSFASMNVFHRWVARVTVLQAIVHSIMWTVIEYDTYYSMFAEMYWATGVFATVTMSLLLPFSIKPIRERWYEFFLISHIVLAVATITLLFYHVTVYDGQYDPYLWACVAVWALDRFIRIVRLQVLSWKAVSRNNAIMHATGGPTGLVRLTVTTSHRHVPSPGVHYFLYTPASLTPWENHPFTVASWDIKENCTDLHFLIGTKAGATRRLRRKLDKLTDLNAGAPLRVLVEGPYGHTCPVERFDRVLFVVGGSGITAALPYIYLLRQQASQGKCVAKEVTLVWMVKSSEYAADVLANELAGVQHLQNLHVNLIIHVTAASGTITPLTDDASSQTGALGYSAPSAEKTAGDGSSENGGSSKSSGGDTFKTGRPAMASVLQAGLVKLVGAETLAVLACGPGSMMDDMRAAVVDAYGTGEGKVGTSTLEYFEESFSW